VPRVRIRWPRVAALYWFAVPVRMSVCRGAQSVLVRVCADMIARLHSPHGAKKGWRRIINYPPGFTLAVIRRQRERNRNLLGGLSTDHFRFMLVGRQVVLAVCRVVWQPFFRRGLGRPVSVCWVSLSGLVHCDV